MKISFKKIKENFFRAPKKIAENSFLVTVLLIVLAVASGGAAFYKYSGALSDNNIEVATSSIKFKEETYQKILTQWQEREDRFKAADSKVYSDLFVK